MRDRTWLVLPAALVGLVVALGAGALRLMALQGWALPGVLVHPVVSHHGELMVFAFLAPVIMLERWVATRGFPLHPVAGLLPVAAGAGSLCLTVSRILQFEPGAAAGTAALAAAACLYVYVLMVLSRWTAQPAVMHIMALAAAALLLALAVTRRVPAAHNMGLTLLLLAFPVLTVLGERIELGSVLNPKLQRYAPRMVPLLAVSVAFFLAGGLAGGSRAGGLILVGGSLLWMAVAAVLARGEVALLRRRGDALYRYLSRSVMVAYGWLVLGALLAAAYGLAPGYQLFDAASHAVALGFVFGMILAHGPVIVPALLGREASWHHLSLWPLALHSAGTVLRVGGRLASPWLPGGWSAAAVGLSWIPVAGAALVLGVLLVKGIRAGEKHDTPIVVTVA